MKGLFIPEITAEMFRNGCLESIEALMEEGEIYDIDYQQPCEDCISRQEAINCVTFNEFRYKMVEDMKTLPSVTPKEEERAVKSLRELTEEYIEEICKEICETRCKYPDIWDEEKEGMQLCESDICKFCPLCDL